MTAGVYRSETRQELLAIWREFGERLSGILAQRQGNFLTDEQKQQIDRLRIMTVTAMHEAMK